MKKILEAVLDVVTNPILWIVVGAVILLALIVIIAIISIKNAKYKFIFETFGGSKIATIKVKKGEFFPMPEDPVKEGYVFAGWYLDTDYKNEFLETNSGKKRTKKVYAKWYEDNVPEKFVKYFENLRNEILSFGRVGSLTNTGLSEKETLAKLIADEKGVYLYVALSSKRVSRNGFDVEDAGSEYPETPTLKFVDDKESYKEAKGIIALLMGIKGLQKIGLAEEAKPMSIKEREEGFDFILENDRVIVNILDYYDYLRIFAKSYTIYNPNNVNDGDTIVRMYLDQKEGCINLYVALSPRGKLVADDRFEDTPSLMKVYDNADDIEAACAFIDRVMISNGLERRNESANGPALNRPKRGCGFAYTITLD